MQALLDTVVVAVLLVVLWGWAKLFQVLALAVYDLLKPSVTSLYKKHLELKKPIALPLRAFSSGEVLYSWEDWNRDAKAEFPIRYFLTETLPTVWLHCTAFVTRPIKDFVYWLKSHTTSRFHMLDIRNPEYDWGWVDRSEVVLYAPFAALTEFMELEEPWKTINWQSDDAHSEAWFEINALYEWWTEGRWADKDRLEKLYEEGYKNRSLLVAASMLDAELKDRDDEMLRRLINVRHYLWT